MVTLILSVKDQFLRELANHFEPKLQMDTRVQIVSDLQMFNPKQDRSVHAQLTGSAPEYFGVYLDNHFIASFTAHDSPQQALLNFWKGLKEKYQAGVVRLAPPSTDEEEVQQQINPLKYVDTSSKERKMAKEIVERVTKGKKT